MPTLKEKAKQVNTSTRRSAKMLAGKDEKELEELILSVLDGEISMRDALVAIGYTGISSTGSGNSFYPIAMKVFRSYYKRTKSQN